jgi:hypothetical protein
MAGMTGRIVAIALVAVVYGAPTIWGALELRALRREQKQDSQSAPSIPAEGTTP